MCPCLKRCPTHLHARQSVPAVWAQSPNSSQQTYRKENVSGVSAESPQQQPTTKVPTRQRIQRYRRCVPAAYHRPTYKTECTCGVGAVSHTHFPTRHNVPAVVALCPTHLPTRQSVPAVLALCPPTLTYKTECNSGVSAVSPHSYLQDRVYLRCWRCVPTLLPTRQCVPAMLALCLHTLTYKTKCTCGVSAVSPHTYLHDRVYLRCCRCASTHLTAWQSVPAVVALCLHTLTYMTKCTCGGSAVSPHTYLQDSVYLRW